MGINTQAETFRGYGKIKTLNAQTAVECRFPQEADTVLTVHCTACLTGAEAGNGEVRYFGKAHFFLVYEDGEKHVCRAEKGVEFSAACKDEEIFPALTARAAISVENVSVRREGASVYVSALLGAEIGLYGDISFPYLTGGDLVMKREPATVLSAHLCGGASEADDEFETEPFTDILQHVETVNVTDVVCETGTVRAEGEINLCLLALKGEDLVSVERLVPFRVEIPCESAAAGSGAEVKVGVISANLKADSDEEHGRCRVTAEFTLSAEGCVYEEVAVDAVTDAFSREYEISLSEYTGEFFGAGETVHLTERIAGKAALSSPVEATDVFEAIALQRAEANLVSSDGGTRAEGVVMATLLLKGADGSHRGVEISLPFSVPVETHTGEIDALVCGMSARRKQDGDVEAEATLRFTLREKKKYTVRLVSSVTEGEKCEENDSAVSVFVPRAGDGLWELSKRLKKSPEEVQASNPDLEFPVQEGQRIVIYRKKSLRA